MRLTHLTFSNFLSHRSLNVPIDPDTRVLLVCGDNGLGKTAVAQGIRMALLGDPERGLKHKKDMAELITEGERDGMVAVSISDDHTLDYKLNLRTGNYASSSPDLPGDPIALEPEQFLALEPKDRRKLLFKLCNIVLKPETIVQELVHQGHTLERVQSIAHTFRNGFDAAAEEARQKASEARGGWKHVAGENYGDKKALEWQAPVPDVPHDLASKDELEQIVREAEADVQRTKQTADQLRADAQAHMAAADAAQAKADLVHREQALSAAQDEWKVAAAKLEEVKQAASYKGGTTCKCPKCATLLYWNAGMELKVWEEAKPALSPPLASQQLPELQREVAQLQNKVGQLQQLVANARAADQLLQNLPAKPDPEAQRKVEIEHQQAQSRLALARADLNVLVNHDQTKQRAAERTAQAKRYHEDVLAYALLAEKITALPAQYMEAALKAIQPLLDEASAAFGTRVTLGSDMELRYGSVRYGLASDSQQWRLRAAIGYALAVIGNLGVTILDRFDTVNVPHRGPILSWLAKQTRVQVILCATLKEQPVKLPQPPFQVVWLEGKSHG